MRPSPRALVVLALIAPLATACSGGEPLPEAPPTGVGTGPRVVWDLGRTPLPEVPLPNDIATRADPNSPTGLRVNASMVAPTGLEAAFRAQFDELDGWGTYQAITIPLSDDVDLGDLARRHQHDDFRFTDDAIYLVDLGPNDPSIPPSDPRYGHPGLPMPLDIGEGDYQYTRRDRTALFANDPRAGESNIVLETVDEDRNHDGILQPWEDTNFDGVLGRPSIFPAGGSAYDNLTGHWDASSRTLILHPLVPLLENHRYAVVVTDRLVGTDGQPVRSPFDTIAHPTQVLSLARLSSDLLGHGEVYGALRYGQSASEPAGVSHVAFAWRYTTQTTVSEWFAVRDGLYGHGPFAQLAQIQPNVAPVNITVGSSSCSPDQRARPFIVRHTPEDPAHSPLVSLFQIIWTLTGASQAERDAMVASYSNVAYLTVGSFHAPYLQSSDPHDTNPQTHWQLNTQTGEMRHVSDVEIPFVAIVPRASAAHPAPFPLAIWTHGYGAGMLQSFSSAGVLTQNGLAVISFDGPTHGLPLIPTLVSVVRTVLRGQCATGLLELMVRTLRARDLNGNGIQDTAGDFWTAYPAHSRDNVRQYALEVSQLVRGIREWNPTTHSGLDFNQNGNPNDDLVGDFDGDGVQDIGASSRMYAIGESLGGMMTMMVGASEPHIRAAIPYAGGGGMSDIALRSSQGGIREAVYLRLMGPIVVGVPATEYAAQDYGSCQTAMECNPGSTCDLTAGNPGRCHRTRTACASDQISLRMIVPDVTNVGELEFACATLRTPPAMNDQRVAATLNPGDDIVLVNLASRAQRCARVQADGRFRTSVASDTNDPLRLYVYRALPGPGGVGVISAIRDFATCDQDPAYQAAAARLNSPMPHAASQFTIDDFRVIEGDCSEGCGHVPTDGLHECLRPDQTDCNAGFHPGYFRVSQRLQALVSPAEGLGLRRQSPDFRRFLTLMQGLLDKGDPISFAPYYFLRATPSFETPERHGVIVTNTVGDQNVPLNTGNAFSRAAGLIPFLPADAPDHLREYRTPAGLQARYGSTPNRVLIDRNVLEGISWLNRWPAPMYPEALFDVDDLDEGTDLFGAQSLTPPLRLVRLARAQINAGELDAVWQPTVATSAWNADPTAPLAATLNYYLRPEGRHSVDKPPSPDLPFDYPTYAYNLAGRFFTTDGTDVYYRTHPATHLCLEDSSCPHLVH